MPTILRVMGYNIYFWSNENGEPIHVHISKGKPTLNATKVWITSSGDVVLEHNKSKIDRIKLSILIDYIRANRQDIILKWIQMFGSITFKY